MAPRRVAAALTDDALENSIREDILGAQGEGDPEPEGEGDPEGDPEPEGEGDPEGDPEPQPRQQRRAPARIREPDDRLSPAAEARIATAERVAAEAVARSEALAAQFSQPRESPEQEAARLATMTPEQQTEYRVNKALGQHNRTIQQTIFNTQNSADKASFDATLAGNPQLKRFAADVERKHSELVRDAQRTNSNVPTRQTVLTYMLGERALELAQKAAPQQRERQQRVQRQQVRPGASRSDVSPTRRQQSTVEQRLENVQI